MVDTNKSQGIIYHHMIQQQPSNDLDIFRNVTISVHHITNAKMAPHQIDEALLACLFHQKPVYIGNILFFFGFFFYINYIFN